MAVSYFLNDVVCLGDGVLERFAGFERWGFTSRDLDLFAGPWPNTLPGATFSHLEGALLHE